MDDLKKRATRARIKAEQDAAVELTDWYPSEKKKLAESGLQGDELVDAERALFMEMGRRAKSNIARAKRQNTIGKMLERDAMERIAER